MLGDILLINENHRKAAEVILRRIYTIKSQKVIISISGESGAGKSEIAHVIAREIKATGQRAKILHTDNYYLVAPAERTAWRKEHGLDHVGLKEYNWDLLNQNISMFKQSKEATLPCIDLLTDQEDRLITDFRGIKYLILEGLYALKAEADLKVFIDLTYHETKKAQILRRKEPQNAFRFRVLEKEHQVVQSIKYLADLVVTKEFDVLKNIKPVESLVLGDDGAVANPESLSNDLQS
jgi:uridine kinase